MLFDKEKVPYDYTVEKKRLFNETGVLVLMRVRDRANRLLGISGACTTRKLMNSIGGDTYLIYASIDYMEETGEIVRVLTGAASSGADDIYIKGVKNELR